MAASHCGQPLHVQAVLSILRKIGMDASALQCGAHLPYDENGGECAAAARAKSRLRFTTTARESMPAFSRSANS